MRARRVFVDRLRGLVLCRRAVQFPNCGREIRSVDCIRNDQGRGNCIVDPVAKRTVQSCELM
jgi:hypothetical protein